jgi:hypothetical protein
MPVKPEAGHPDATQLEVDVRTLRHGDAAPPDGQHLVVAVAVGADPVQPAQMVQDDAQIGHGLGEGRQLGRLRKA